MDTTTEDQGRVEGDRLAAMVALQGDLDAFRGDRTELLGSIAARTLGLTSAVGVAIERLHGDQLYCDAGAGLLAAAAVRPVADSVVPGVHIHGDVLIFGDDHEGLPGVGTRYAQVATGSVLLTPIHTQAGVTGVLVLVGAKLSIWPTFDRQTAQIIAAFAGAAYECSDREYETPAESIEPLNLSQYQSLLDPTTGIPNRSLLFDRLQQGIHVARREDEPLAVLVAGVTDSSLFREHFGQDAADAVIVELAVRSRETLRASDTVARSTPDTLGILLPGANAIGAVGTAKKLVRAASQPYQYQGQNLPLTLHVGIAIYPEHGDDPAALLLHAERALASGEEATLPMSVQLYEDD